MPPIFKEPFPSTTSCDLLATSQIPLKTKPNQAHLAKAYLITDNIRSSPLPQVAGCTHIRASHLPLYYVR